MVILGPDQPLCKFFCNHPAVPARLTSLAEAGRSVRSVPIKVSSKTSLRLRGSEVDRWGSRLIRVLSWNLTMGPIVWTQAPPQDVARFMFAARITRGYDPNPCAPIRFRSMRRRDVEHLVPDA